MIRIIKEPFLHFIVLGGIIFLAYGWLSKDTAHPEGYDILISPDHQVKMAIQYQKNFGALPDSTVMQHLIAAEVKNEIFYREALRLGLDTDDEVIRRRLKQKYEFIQMDNVTSSEPSESELRSFYDEHQNQYKTAVVYSFTHHYFSPDVRDDPHKDASSFIRDGGSGDSFHIPSPLSNQDIDDIRNAFGFQFSEDIKGVEEENNFTIIKSGFGIHAVKILSKTSSTLRPYDEVRSLVYQDYVQDLRSSHNEALYNELHSQYNITVEEL